EGANGAKKEFPGKAADSADGAKKVFPGKDADIAKGASAADAKDAKDETNRAPRVPMETKAIIQGVNLIFRTKPTLFSPTSVDRGTMAMLSRVSFGEGEKVLDLGCGYGVAGIWAAKLIGQENVFMIDNDDDAIKFAKINAELNGVPGISTTKSDGFRDFNEAGFSLVLSNPPYHSDFSVPKHFIEKGFNRLRLGGRMMMVTHRLPWYKNKLSSVFGGVKVEEDNGYFVFTAEKRSMTYANSK
ncbi:MAG: methyltransferase, partial [Clostridiales bacterium]|nr:methyltransferase [Clostridiales bacterium]